MWKVLLSNCWDQKYSCGDGHVALASILATPPLGSELKVLLHGDGAPKATSFAPNVVNIGWVSSYTDLISDVHVQVFPIRVGTGTKGKVLSAVAMGCLCIGSSEAFSNIAMPRRGPHLIYQRPEDVGELLRSALTHYSREALLRTGSYVRAQHDPGTVIAKFWNSLDG